MRHLLYILLAPVLFFSCNKDIYHDFTEEEKAFLVYDKGDTFKLKDKNTGDTIEFKVTERYLRHIQDSPSGMSVSTKTHYEHQGRIEFERIDDPSNTGYIYIRIK